jgi:hypothetical protein
VSFRVISWIVLFGRYRSSVLGLTSISSVREFRSANSMA